MTRSRRDRRSSSPFFRTHRLGLEMLEARDCPAGGLSAQLIPGNDAHVLINMAGGETAEVRATTAAATGQLFSFFGADHPTSAVTVDGSLKVGGRSVRGSFTFGELASGGVGVAAANVQLDFGGVHVADAGGAIALLPGGVAGRLTTEDLTDGNGLTAPALPGLGLDSGGMSYEINTTGGAVNVTVPTSLGNESLSFTGEVDRLHGSAKVKVQGPSGPAFTVKADDLTATEAGGGLAISASGVAVGLYSGSTQAIALSSATAEFTLGSDSFALVEDSFTVSGVTFLPEKGLPAVPGGTQGGQQTFSARLGPIAFQGLGITLPTLSYGIGGLSIDVGLSAASASLAFAGQGGEGGSGQMSATAAGLSGTFNLAGAVNATTGNVTSLGTSGKFAVHADTFDLTVPGVLVSHAEELDIAYDPRADDSQEIVRADSLDVEVTPLEATGSFTGTDQLPGLVVYGDGFAFGSGRVTLQRTLTAGPLSVESPYAELGNFSFRKSTGVDLDTFAVGAAGITVAAGDFALTGEDVRTELGFNIAGGVDHFTFSVQTLTGAFGELVTVEASEVAFTPTATGSETMLSVGSATATATISAVDLTLLGSMSGLTVAGDGSVSGPDTLSISLDPGDDAASKLKLPSYIPFRVDTLDLDWDDFDDHPEQFTITVSASVTGTLGLFSFTGGVDNLVLDPYALADGENPIIDLDGFNVGVSGNVFGGTIEGAVVGGVVKLDAEGNVILEGDDATPVVSTVFYAGIQGGFQFGDIGAQIMVGFSEKGFLQAYLRADVPITIEPISGLTLSGFRGGISFNATPLPDVTDPEELRDPIFQPTTSLTLDQWQEQLKQQVVNQVSGGSRIFVIEDDVTAIVGELDGGSVAADGTLAGLFDDAGYAVADAEEAGSVTTLTAGSLWMVTYKGATYLIEKVGDKLDVTRARFVTDDAAFAAALAPGQVAPAVVAAFTDHELVLHDDAKVEALDGGKWKITDGDTTYFVTNRGGRMAITGGDIGAADAVVRIEAGATMYSKYISDRAFHADVDIVITTDGKFVVLGKAVLGERVSANVRLYADLSSVDDAQPADPVKLVFLGDFPAPSDGIDPLVVVKGIATIEFLDAAGNLVNPAVTGVTPDAFRFHVVGRGEMGISDKLTAVFGGDAGPDGDYADLDFSVKNRTNATEVEVNVAGSLSIEGLIDAENLVSAAGRMILTKPADGPLELIGAVQLDFTTENPGLSFLADAGISADASLLLGFNTTTQSKDLELKLPGRDAETITLDPVTLMLEGEGSLHFANSKFGVGADVSFDGAFSSRLSVDVPRLTLPGPASTQLDQHVIPQPIVAALNLTSAATVNAITVEDERRWKITDGNKNYYVVTRGSELAVLDNSRAGSDLTVRGDRGVDLDLFVAGKLDVSVTVGQEFNLMSLDAVGVLALRDLGATVNGTVQAPHVIGRVDLLVSAGVQGVAEITGSAQLLINTLGREFTYAIPDRLQDRLQAIQDRRADSDGTQLPPLPVAEDGSLAVTVPAGAPLLEGGNAPDGAYFMLQFGDSNESGTGDADGDGLVDVSLTILDAFRLEGDFRVVVAQSVFQLDVSANASLALPGAEDLFNGEVTGSLHVSAAGMVGYIGLQANLDVPQLEVGGGIEAYLGVNTTGTDSLINFQNPNLIDPALPTHSAALYLGGKVAIAGFELEGNFGLTVGASSLSLDVHAGLELFDITGLTVDGTATLYYGNDPGLVLHAGLSVGNGKTEFGIPGIFTAKGNLTLDVDTRIGYGKIAVNDFELSLLSVITVSGSASITAGNDQGVPYFRVDGQFNADLFGIATVSAGGFFDSRGYFAVDLHGGFELGDDDWGIKAAADLHASYQLENGSPRLRFSGSGTGKVSAAGRSVLGANLGISYDSNSGEIIVSGGFNVGKLRFDVDETLGFFKIGAEADPRLARVENGELILNVGADASRRNIRRDEVNEVYTLKYVGDSANGVGKDVLVRAFGASTVFHNVTSIRGSFGSGNDRFRLLRPAADLPALAIPIDVHGDGGDDRLENGSAAKVTFWGDDGNDSLFAGSGADELRGGNGDDTITWLVGGSSLPTIDGEAGNDTLTVVGTDAADQFTLSPVGADLQVVVGGATSLTLTVPQVEAVTINARGGADTVLVNDLAGRPVTVDLGTLESSSSGTRDDAARDRLTARGTGGIDTYTVQNGDTAEVQVKQGETRSFLVTGITPGSDELYVEGGAGNDSLTVKGPRGGDSAGERLKIHLDGGSGSDAYTLPIGGATFTGDGNDSATFTVDGRDPTGVTLTSTRISTGSSAATAYSGLSDVAVTTSTSAGITVESTHTGTTHVTLGVPGTVTVKSTSGTVTATGSGSADQLVPDKLVIDTSASPVPREGTMNATSFSKFVAVDYDKFDLVDVHLGDGSDQFTIDGTASGAATTIDTGSGADEVHVLNVGGVTTVNEPNDPDNSADTLYADFTNPGTGADDPLAGLTFTTGKVVVSDLSTSPAAPSVDWKYVNGVVSANGRQLLKTFGIPTTFKAASGADDALTVEDQVDAPQVVNVEGARVRIQEGANVLSFNNIRTFSLLSYGVTVDGLNNVQSVALSPDGDFLYAVGFDDDAVSVFRRDSTGTLTFVQSLKDGQFGVDGLDGATSIAVSGTSVYVGSINDNSVVAFSRVPLTGRLVYRGRELASGGVTSLAISADGTSLYGTTASSVFRMSHDLSTGALTTREQRSYGTAYKAIAIGQEGTDLFVAGTRLDRVALGAGGVLPDSIPAGVFGIYDDVVTGPNKTVYASWGGGVDRFSYGSGTLTFVATAVAPDNAHRASSTAVALTPDGSQLIAGFDPNSVPASPSVKHLRLESLQAIDTNDEASNDEPYIQSNGVTIYEADEDSVDGGDTVGLNYDTVVGGTVTIQVYEDDFGSDPPVGTSFSVSSSTPDGHHEVDLKTRDSITGNVFIHYRLTYTVYTVTSATPSVTPVVLFDRASSGSLGTATQVDFPSISRLEDLETTADSQHYYGASASTDQITRNTFIAATDGESQAWFALPTAPRDEIRTVFTSDDKFAYSVSAKYNVITVSSVNTATGALNAPSQVIPAGVVAGSSIAISPNGKAVYVTNPAEDSLLVYSRDTTSGALALAQVFTDGVNGAEGLDGARALFVGTNERLYVAGHDEDAIAVFQIDPNARLSYVSKFTHADLDGPSSMTMPNNLSLIVTSANNGKILRLEAQTSGLSYRATVSAGVANPVASALSPDSKQLYVVSKADSAVAVFSLEGGNLSLTQTLRNGGDGVQDIDGASTVAVAGPYVFVGGSTDTLAVFGPNESGNGLIILQRLRDGAAGASGLNGVTDLDAVGGKLYVSSAGAEFGNGGVAALDIASTGPTAQVYDVSFTGVENLTVRTADGADTVNAGEVAVNFTVDTNDGPDAVTLRDTPANRSTTVNLADGIDTITVFGTGNSSTLTVNAGNGIDEITLYATGSGATTKLNGGLGNDRFFVDGVRLESQVQVDGEIEIFRVDTLVFDAHGQATNPVAGEVVGNSHPFSSDIGDAGTRDVKIASKTFGVTYRSTERIEVIGSPTAKANGPYSLNEGGSLTLSGGSSIPSTQTLVSYEWTVGTRVFSGSSVSLNWQDLVASGIDDDGTYKVALTVTTRDSDGTLFRNTDTADVTVSNTGPMLTATGLNTAEVGSLYTLTLSSADPGADTVHTWKILWADGSPEELYHGSSVTVTHLYTTAANRTIQFKVIDEDGTTSAVSKPVSVAPARTISGPATVNEGSPYSLTLGRGAAGLPAISRWTINWGDGSSPQVVSGDPTSVNHTYAADGAYTVSAVATDVNGVAHPAGNTVSVTVKDVVPSVFLTVLSPSAVEGDPTRPLTLKVNITDPGNEPVVSYVVNWGDGTTSTVIGAGSNPQHVYADAKTYLVSVTSLTNGEGTFRPLGLPRSMNVGDVAPMLSPLVVTPEPGEEAGPITVRAVALGPVMGTDTLTFQWHITGPNGYDQTVEAPADAVLASDPATQFPGLPAAYFGQARMYPTTVSFTPPDSGSYSVTLVVQDDEGQAATQSVSVTVANLAPTIGTFEVPPTGVEGQVITLRATASDPVGAADPLCYTWTVTNTLTHEVLTLTGSVTAFTPDGGDYLVQLSVKDDDGGEAVRSASIAVTSLPPTIIDGSLSVPASANEAATATFSVQAIDNEGTTTGLSYAWQVAGPNGLAAFLTGSSVNYTFPDNGTFTVRVTVTDEEGMSVTSAPRTVVVANLNPVIGDASMPTAGTEGVGLSLHASATDPAGVADPLAYVWTITAPSGQRSIVIGQNPTFTPPEQGSYGVSLSVTDGDGGSATRDLGTIDVANAAPTLGPIVLPDRAVKEGETVTLRVSGDDVPGDVLTYDWVITTPAGQTLTRSGTRVTFVADDSGNFAISVTVRDGDDGSASGSAVLSVQNLDPTLTDVSVPTVGYVNHGVALHASAADVVGDAADLTYTWTVVSPLTSAVTLSGADAVFTPGTAATYSVFVTVRDGDGGAIASAVKTLTVRATPITITQLDVPAAGQEGSPVRLSAGAVDALNGGPITFTWTVTPEGGTPFTLTGHDAEFTPADDARYAVRLVASNGNGQAEAMGAVDVANVAPGSVQVNGPGTKQVGDTVNLHASAIDLDPLTFTWAVTRPDGTTFAAIGADLGYVVDQIGVYGVQLSVKDDDGGEAVVQKLLAVVNAPPKANAGGPYQIAEGESLHLDASGSSDVNQSAATLTYEWDVNGDGVYTDAVGATPTLTWAQLQALGINDGPGAFTVRVRVTDAYGAADMASAGLSVTNAPPTITSLYSTNGDPMRNPTNGLVGIGGTFTDPGQDSHQVRVNWGDGSPVSTIWVLQGWDVFLGAHAYASGGIYTVTVTAIDSDGAASAPVTTRAVVSGVRLDTGTLYVLGTDGDDDIKVKAKHGNKIEVDAKLGGNYCGDDGSRIDRTFNRADVQKIVVLGYDGDDKIDLKTGSDSGTTVTVPVIALGGEGDDDINGGHGSNVLVGGDGDDKLTSGPGRSVLIGGKGSDALKGGSGEDVLIGGYTSNDADLAALDQIFTKWNSSASFTARVSDLKAGLLKAGVTVFDDGESDDIKGLQGRDWLIGNLLGSEKDKVDYNSQQGDQFDQLS